AQMPELGKKKPTIEIPAPAASAPASPPLVENYISYGLDELASAQALKYIGSIDKAKEAELAFALSAQGQHYAALRLARDAVNRGLGSSMPELWGLVYPLAWRPIVSAGATIPGIPEALAYAIIRSESVFDPKAVSYAGAVGLTQLMPATAAETAKGIGITKPVLTDPEVNVRIGMTYYSYMLARFGGKPMRAMFAYNAGPSRMAGWSKESGELPDDILLETLHIAQPRQYAKNIIQAALAYGKIHYGILPGKLLDYLVLGKPLEPEAQVQPISASAPSQTTDAAPVAASAGAPATASVPTPSAEAPVTNKTPPPEPRPGISEF
ncbi:MAG TPA: lytic transglycosylase domain-containing protein, partial [Rectinemataceae bacterium]